MENRYDSILAEGLFVDDSCRSRHISGREENTRSDIVASQELNQALWNAANVMRSTMSADEYKNYLLGLVFYKYLSDRQLYAVVDLLEDRQPESLDEAQEIYEGAVGGEAIRGQKPYEDLFEDFDIDSKSLGATPAKRNSMLADVMKELAHIDFTEYGADALGDAYEYLIGEFAAGSGKKAGEFYTPSAVSELITRIVTKGKEGKPGFSIYDKRVAYLIQANGK